MSEVKPSANQRVASTINIKLYFNIAKRLLIITSIGSWLDTTWCFETLSKKSLNYSFILISGYKRFLNLTSSTQIDSYVIDFSNAKLTKR